MSRGRVSRVAGGLEPVRVLAVLPWRAEHADGARAVYGTGEGLFVWQRIYVLLLHAVLQGLPVPLGALLPEHVSHHGRAPGSEPLAWLRAHGHQLREVDLRQRPVRNEGREV